MQYTSTPFTSCWRSNLTFHAAPEATFVLVGEEKNQKQMSDRIMKIFFNTGSHLKLSEILLPLSQEIPLVLGLKSCAIELASKVSSFEHRTSFRKIA